MRPMDSAWKTQMSPPLALLVLGALTPPDDTVDIADENAGVCSFDDRPDLVGITVKVDTARRSFAIADEYRAKGVPVVMGGIHATACPEDCLVHADSVVVGEAENLWKRVLDDCRTGNLRPVYRNESPVDIASSPTPRWDLLNHRNYLFTNTLTISRGCPWRCEFCYNSSENVASGYRLKPVANILHDIESMNTDHVMFIDDNFIGHPKKIRELLPELAARGITWHAAVSADVGKHRDLVAEMAAAGCRSLFIGFETVNEKSLLACRKTQNRIDSYDETIALLHAQNIMVNASVVFGFDSDNESVFQDTLSWLVRNRIATMTAHILTPFPGTAFYQKLKAENRITDDNLDHYNTAHVVYKPKGMTAERLLEGYHWMYQQFYSWPNMIRRRPPSQQQRMAYWQFNLVYRKYGKFTSRLGRLWGMRRVAETARRVAYPRLR